jgi:hypothetical protein
MVCHPIGGIDLPEAQPHLQRELSVVQGSAGISIQRSVESWEGMGDCRSIKVRRTSRPQRCPKARPSRDPAGGYGAALGSPPEQARHPSLVSAICRRSAVAGSSSRIRGERRGSRCRIGSSVSTTGRLALVVQLELRSQKALWAAFRPAVASCSRALQIEAYSRLCGGARRSDDVVGPTETRKPRACFCSVHRRGGMHLSDLGRAWRQ